MDKYFVLAGLFLNLVGVILIYFGIKPFKEGPQAGYIDDDGKCKMKAYASEFNYGFLNSGLTCLVVGIILQMVGVSLQGGIFQ